MPAIAWSACVETFSFTYVSPAAETLLGYPVERWMDGNFWVEHLHPDDRGVAELCHNETLAARDHELVYRMIAADGRVVWLRDYVKVHTVDGAPVELFGVMVDITREREAEAASNENRENFRRMVELSPDCIGVHVDQRYAYVNRAFVQLLGATSEADIIGRSVFSFLDAADVDAVRERLGRLSAGESVPYRRQKVRRIDGSLIDVEVAALPLRYGNRDAVQVIARDITPVVEAERMRAAAEAKFRWLVEQSVVAVYMMSGNRFTYINDRGAKLLGYSASELTSIHPADLLDGDDPPAAVFGGGPSVARVRRKDSTMLHLALYPNEVVVDGETIIIGTAADVTGSVQAQQALEASEQRYRELVDGVGDILFTVDHEGLFLSLSRSFERSTGYRVDEWIGRPFEELFRPHSAPGAGQFGEYELPAKIGSVVTVEVSSQPRYVDGVVAGRIGMARDVTQSRTIARKLEEAKRMSSLGQVAASLAHEFNNVLMGIQPFVEIIARNSAGARGVDEAVGHITRSIGRGKRASQEILRFANPKEPQLSSIDAWVWLPAFLGQLAAGLPSTIALAHSIEPDVRFLRGDREHLEQVITNLVFNARDAVSGRGTIDICVSRVDAEVVRISVCDDGPGIASQFLDRVFEPLFTTKRNGTGLGLAIARRLMEQQGGALTAENRLEGGAAFHLLVPAGRTDVLSVIPGRCATPSLKRILLVEDDLSAGAGLEELLNAEGYETTWVRAFHDACDAARRILPEVAIIDVNLPDGNGIDLVPLLRAEHRNLPIVLSTGHVELNLRDEDDRILSLMKPYELTDLLAAIGNVTVSA